MAINLGTVKPGSTIYIPYNTFSSDDPSASIAIAALVVGDIEVYKDGSITQRASNNGYTLLDTDGIDFDGHVGIGGISIDLADNSTGGFWASGSRYFVMIGPVTVDAGVVNFIAATFDIGYSDAILNTTIASLTSATQFILTDGPAEADVFIGSRVILHDVASKVQVAFGIVSDYIVSTKEVFLVATPVGFTPVATDNVSLFMPNDLHTVRGTVQTAGDLAALIVVADGVIDAIKLETDKLTLGDAGAGQSGSIIEEIENRPTTAMRGTDSVVLSGPTKTEMDTAHGLLATESKQDTAKTEIDLIKTEADKIAATDAGAGVAGSVIETIENIPTTAMRGTDGVVLSGPTRVEATSDKDSIETNIAALNDAPAVTASSIADAVLDELTAGHVTAGSLSKAIIDILADTNELQVDDTPGAISALNNLSSAQVNTQADLALSDFFTSAATLVNLFWDELMVELPVAAPDATPKMRAIMAEWHMVIRNKVTINGSFKTVSNDAGTVIFKKATSEAGGTYTEAEAETGP